MLSNKMTSSDFNLSAELNKLIHGLQIAQKKGCYDLDEAAMVHSAIVKIQANPIQTPTVSTSDESNEENIALKTQIQNIQKEYNTLAQQAQQIQTERNQLVSLLEEYKKAIEEFKKQHDETLFNIKMSEEKNKELKTQLNIYEKENIELKNDLTELINADMQEEDVIIPVVKPKPEKAKKKSTKKAST